MDSGLPAPESVKALLLDGLKRDSSVFLAIDLAVVAVIFICLVAILRACLRRLAGEEADHGMTKVFLTSFLFVVVALFAALSPVTFPYKYFLVLPVFLLCVLLLHLLCRCSMGKSALILSIIALSGTAMAVGLSYGIGCLLPRDRITLLQSARTSPGPINESAGRERAPVFTTNTTRQTQAGLRPQGEAVMGAIHLLQHPDNIQERTAQHTEDLRALDLTTDGKAPSPAALLELGITPDESKDAAPGLEALRRIHDGDEVTEQDVEAVAGLLRTVHDGKAEVTAQDIAILICGARNRGIAQAEAQLSAAQAAAQVTEVAAPGLTRATPAAPAAPEHADPLELLDAGERENWLRAQDTLRTTAVLQRGDETWAMVNRQMVRVGDVYVVESEGRRFTWRLVDAYGFKAFWEPVLDADAASGSDRPPSS